MVNNPAITQADREAAAKIYAEFVGFLETVDEGDWMARHLARHREQAVAEKDAEITRLREVLAQIAGNNWRDQSRAHFVARQALESRSQPKEQDDGE